MTIVDQLVEPTLTEMSAETPLLVATPAPLGKPGGPGLYHLKGAKLPNYIENMRNALMRGGMSEGRATATAISRCKVLAVTSKHPEVKAAAAAAIAELKATAARAKAAHGHTETDAAEVLEFFNPYHLPAGAGGGQFTTAAKGGGGGAGKKPPKGRRVAPMKRQGPVRTITPQMRSQKRTLIKRIATLHLQIRGLETKLIGLMAQKHSIQSTGGSKRTGTTKKLKKATAKKTKSTTTKASTKAKKTTTAGAAAAKKAAALATVNQQIASVRRQITAKRALARTLSAQAAKL